MAIIKLSSVSTYGLSNRLVRRLYGAGFQEIGLKRARADLRNRYVRGAGVEGGCGSVPAGRREGRGRTGRKRRESIPIRSPAWRSNMADKNKVAEQYYAPPPDLGKWEAFRIFLWNSETGQFLGRTGSSWGEYTFHKISDTGAGSVAVLEGKSRSDGRRKIDRISLGRKRGVFNSGCMFKYTFGVPLFDGKLDCCYVTHMDDNGS